MSDTSAEAIVQSIIGQLHLTEQLDALHLDLVSLRDMSQDDETDPQLDDPGTSDKQKAAFLQKIVSKLVSPELKNSLQAALHEGDIDIFTGKRLIPFLNTLRDQAESVENIKVRVAVRFKPEDLRDFAQILEEKLGHPIVFDIQVERGLLGGAIIQYGTYITDYSLKTRLDQFRSHWEKAVAA